MLKFLNLRSAERFLASAINKRLRGVRWWCNLCCSLWLFRVHCACQNEKFICSFPRRSVTRSFEIDSFILLLDALSFSLFLPSKMLFTCYFNHCELRNYRGMFFKHEIKARVQNAGVRFLISDISLVASFKRSVVPALCSLTVRLSWVIEKIHGKNCKIFMEIVM